jgi:hypothetical protein
MLDLESLDEYLLLLKQALVARQASIKSSRVSTKNHPNSDCKREFLSCLNFLLSMYKES